MTQIQLDEILELNDDLVEEINASQSYHLKKIDPMRFNAFPMGFEIEKFMYARLQSSQRTPLYFGSLSNIEFSRGRKSQGIITGKVGNTEAHNINAAQYFYDISQPNISEEERLKSIILSFMDIFYALHHLQGPSYQNRFVPLKSHESPDAKINYLHNDITPLNIIINSEGDLARAMLIDFDVTDAVGQNNELLNPTWFRPPENVSEVKFDSSTDKDLFAVATLLIGALSRMSLGYSLDYMKQMQDTFLMKLANQRIKPNDPKNYIDFLGKPIDGYDQDILKSFFQQHGLESAIENADANHSIFQILMNDELSTWACFKTTHSVYQDQLKNLIFQCMGMVCQDNVVSYAPSMRPEGQCTALSCFQHLSRLWFDLNGVNSSNEGDELYRLYHNSSLVWKAPVAFSELKIEYDKVELPLNPGAQIDLSPLQLNGIFPTLVFDWNVYPYLNQQHFKEIKLDSLSQNVSFRRIDIDTAIDKTLNLALEFPDFEITSYPVLVQYGQYVHPEFIQVSFNASIDSAKWHKKVTADFIKDYLNVGNHDRAPSSIGSTVDGMIEFWRKIINFDGLKNIIDENNEIVEMLAVIMSNTLFKIQMFDVNEEFELIKQSIQDKASNSIIYKNLWALIDSDSYVKPDYFSLIDIHFYSAASIQLCAEAHRKYIEKDFFSVESILVNLKCIEDQIDSDFNTRIKMDIFLLVMLMDVSNGGSDV